MSKDLVSFAELTIPEKCNITKEVIKHTAQAGSIFGHRARCLKALEIAKDKVKEELGRIEMDTHILGKIPVNGEPTIKITGAAVTAYCNSHPDVIKARSNRAQAEFDYDTAKAVVTAYLAKKELLQLMMADRKNEFYSEPTCKAEDAVPNYNN